MKCVHTYKHVRNIHGDERNTTGNLVEFVCQACGKVKQEKYWFIGSGETSDGYHTFNELYYHRMILFAVICNQNKEKAWKSKLHADGTMYDNYFIVGITTDEGDYTYHYHLDYWDYFNVSEIPNSPEWDGHKPEDITRLLTLNNSMK